MHCKPREDTRYSAHTYVRTAGSSKRPEGRDARAEHGPLVTLTWRLQA